MPFFDTSAAYKEFRASPVLDQPNEQKRGEFQELVVHKIAGPGGQVAITTDGGPTELTRPGPGRLPAGGPL